MSEVMQEDREAAADTVKAYREIRNYNWQQRIRQGQCDDGAMVQAFATFRREVEWRAYRRAARVCDDHAAMRERLYEENGATVNAHRAVEAEECAAAIRGLGGQGRAPPQSCRSCRA